MTPYTTPVDAYVQAMARERRLRLALMNVKRNALASVGMHDADKLRSALREVIRLARDGLREHEEPSE